MPPVSRYMTNHPYAISPHEKLSSARHLMATRDIHHLPVMEHDELVGIVSDRDLHPVHPLHDMTVGELMTEDVAHVSADTPMDEVIDLMERKHCSSVVVLGLKGVEGIFTVTDALRALGDLLRRTVEDRP
ncbi:MAG TPA: CBS domain-containing protein [Kofleriaceae bacterium]|nr:CBS domain-containing protein [Kofleriaceae bacterium]